MAAAQIWTLVALLAAAQFATFLEMRRIGDRMNDGFGALSTQIGELRGEVAILRHEVHEHFFRDH